MGNKLICLMDWCDMDPNIFAKTGHCSYIRVDLDAITNNVNILRSRVATNTELIAVVKGGGYGHGGVPVSRHLKSIGVRALAVATGGEGRSLRKGGLQGKIHVVGNFQPEDIDCIVENDLIPTVSWSNGLKSIPKDKLVNKDGTQLKVNIKVDSGMSRYGVQCDELEALMQDLHALDVGIESIFTHFAGGIMDNDGNLDQFNQFMTCTDPLVNKNISRHAAATTGCCQKIGTELDFVRPGGSLYGLCSGNDLPGSTIFQKLGFQPAMSIIARPTFYKLLPAGRHVGYDRMYTTDSPEWIANIACGWSDGYRRQLSFGRGAMKNNRTGELCPIAGRISMDSCTLKLPQKPQPDDTYSVLTADYADRTSYSWMARALDAANYEITGTWSTRLPRVYIKQGEVHDILHAVDYSN